MSEYYNRRFSLELDEKELIAESSGRQFRITFNVLIDFGGYNSYADISIYGLSRDTEAKAFKRGQRVALRCGYENSVDFIFQGDLVNIFREKRGADKITRLICRSGAVDRTEKSINRTLGEGSVLPDIIKACADALGLPLVINNEDFTSVPPYAGGKVLFGSPDTILKELSKTHGFEYTVENGKIVVVGKGAFRNGGIHQISQFTGMVGAPEITEVGADVTIRMNPKIKIGGRFQITSEFKTFNFSDIRFQDVPESAGTGIYRIFRIEHEGDSYGDDWNTKISGFI
jgi:hypothetical protein